MQTLLSKRGISEPGIQDLRLETCDLRPVVTPAR